MLKLVLEVLKNKIFAFWLTVSVLIMAFAVTIYYNAKNEGVIIERYSISKITTIQDANNEIKDIENELKELSLNDPYRDNIIQDCKSRIKIIEEIKRNNLQIDYEKVYQGEGTTASDSISFIFDNMKFVLLLTVSTFVILTGILFCREFDNGVYIHVYNKNRTKEVLTRFFVVLLFSMVIYFVWYFFLAFLSRSYTDTIDFGLIIDKNRAFFIEKKQYLIVYAMIRYLFISVFLSLVIGTGAIILKKTLPMIAFAAFIVTSYFIFNNYYGVKLAYLGITDVANAYMVSNNYYNYTLLYAIIPAVLLLSTTKFYFEKEDL